MRTVAPQTLSYLQKNQGTEPILVLGIAWTEGSQEVLYSDQRIDGANYPHPTIIQVSGFDTALMVSGSGDSQSINVTLDDVDGQLKWIFNNHDIHKRPVKVYHHFRGLDLNYKFLIFRGEINSPVVWNEGERQLSFTVLTHTEDAEVAFSMEEGDFPNIPADALGKVWPLIFGQVCNMQAVQVRSPRKGYLLSGEGWHDFTLHPRICQARYIQCPSIAIGEVTTISPGPDDSYQTNTAMDYGPDPNCVDDRFETLCALLDRLDQEMSYEHSPINVRGGDNFPQGETVKLNVDGALLEGSFSGESFTITSREHPDYAGWEHDECEPIADHAYTIRESRWDNNWDVSNSGTAWYRNEFPLETVDDCEPESGVFRQQPAGGSSASWKAFEDMEAASFVWKPAGTEVFMEGEAEILYIVSLIPGTVDSVAAYRQMSTGRSLLMEVPSDYYTVYETDYEGYTVMEIGFDKRLSLYDSDWSDDIYVSFTSDEGPNPVDTIEWLLTKYTNLTFDSTSFNDVKTKLANYPCNFWVKDRKNILQLIHDIAYQSRCAVYIRNNVMFIKYLSEEPSSVRTITESDILAGTFEMYLTETEDVATKHTIDWQKSEAGVESTDATDLKIILKHNVPKYGIAEENWDYYSQNTFDTILKSATFWLIRRANTWKRVEFDTPLSQLDLDIFDCITLDVAQFSSVPIKVVIESSTYRPDSNTIHFECWTPVLAGTEAEYILAWPAYQDAAVRFPQTEEELYAGAGYDFEVTPPIGHILRSGYVDTGDAPAVIESAGDQNPSDLDDTFPTVTCELSDTMDVAEDDPAFTALKLARNTRSSLAENQQSPAPAKTDENKKPRRVCGDPVYGSGCLYEIYVTYVYAISVTSGRILGGCAGGPCLRSGCGNVCTSTFSAMCHTFGAAFSANMFIQNKRKEIQALVEGCGYCAGGTFPYAVGTAKTVEDPSAPWDVCGPLPGDPGDPNQGEPFAPSPV